MRHVNPVSRAKRNINFGHHLLRDPAERRSRDGGDDCGDAGFVPADSSVYYGCACGFDLFGELDDFVPVGALIDEVKH